MNKIKNDLRVYLLLVILIVVAVILGQSVFKRLDLTSEKRFSLNHNTIELLKEVQEPLIITVYLEGEFPSGFKRLQRETKQMLEEFRAYNRNIEFQFVDPNESGDAKTVREIYQQLQFKGLVPILVEINEGAQSQNLQFFPAAIASYGEKETGIQLLYSQLNVNPESQINSAIQNLEYTLANAVRKLTQKFKPGIAFANGHGELDEKTVEDFSKSLMENYNVSRVNIREFPVDSNTMEVSITSQMRRLNSYDILVFAKPTQPFLDLDLYLIDQYVMNGGKILWMVDAVAAEMDSLSKKPEFLAYPILEELRINKLFFRYGARINTNLIQDRKAAWVSDMRSSRPWIYFPLLSPLIKHPITKDLNGIKLEYASTIDTVMAPNVRKTPLLKTSDESRVVLTPHMVRLASLYNYPGEQPYNKRYLTTGVLLEGQFTSLFKNQLTPKEQSGEKVPFKAESTPTSQIIIADGDFPRNQFNVVNPNMPKGAALTLGYDQYTGVSYGNKDFLLNAIDYLLDNNGLIALRSRELKMRLLNSKKIQEEKITWQLLNIALPIGILLLFGILFQNIRKRKYS